MSVGFDGQREVMSDILRRGSAEPPSFTPTIEQESFQDVSSLDNGIGHPGGKGSRFAKFFDGKTREGGTPVIKSHTTSSSPGPGGQRQEHGGFNGMLGGSPDPRAMDEIYVMLNSSVQVNIDILKLLVLSR